MSPAKPPSPEELRRAQQGVSGIALAIARDLEPIEAEAERYPDLATLAYLIMLARQEAERAHAALLALSEREP